MEQLLGVSLCAIVAILSTTVLFYECLCLISRLLSKTSVKPRSMMFIMVIGIFIAHAVAILIYAVIYWTLIHYAGFPDLSGNIQGHFLTYLYFSVTMYSSLGIGDVFPMGALRFLAGIEAINGLILITWSAAFTYFSVQKMWDAHNRLTKFTKSCDD